MQRYYWTSSLELDDLATEMALHLKHFRSQHPLELELESWHASSFVLQLSINNTSCARAGLSKGTFVNMISECSKQGQRFSCQREVCKHLHKQRFTKAAVLYFVAGWCDGDLTDFLHVSQPGLHGICQ